MRRLPLLALLLVVPVACGGAVVNGSDASGIEGRATIGPQCPVEIVGSPCPDLAFSSVITVRTSDGNTVLVTETGDDGRFRIPLPPGTYTIEAEPVEPGGIARMEPLEPVTVRADTFTNVTISFDSGIR